MNSKLIQNIGLEHLSGCRQPVQPAYSVNDKHFGKHYAIIGLHFEMTVHTVIDLKLRYGVSIKGFPTAAKVIWLSTVTPMLRYPGLKNTVFPPLV